MQVNWEDFRYFLTLAETGSFSAAARRLSVDHSMVVRRVGLLEADLGLRLIDRLPKAVMLTEEGTELARKGQDVVRDILSVERAAVSLGQKVSGTVCASVPPAMANIILAPRLPDLRRDHPEIDLILLGEVSFSALDKRQADISLRLSRPTQNGLVTRKIADLPFGFYGAKDATICEKNWNFINWDKTHTDIPQYAWIEKRLQGRDVVLRANDISIQARAAAAGVGVALLPDFIGARHPMLHRLHVDDDFPPRELWIAVHDDLRKAPRVRAVLDFLITIVGDHLSRPG